MLRWAAGAVGLLAGGALVLILAVFLALQSERVSTSLARMVTEVLSSRELSLEVGGVRGSWVRGLSVTGVRASFAPGEGEGGWEVAVDTVSLSYRLLPLLWKTIRVEGVEVAGIRARVTMTEREPEAPGDGREEAGPWLPGGWELRVGAVGLRAAGVEVWEGDGPGEGEPGAEAWTATDVRVRLRDLRVGSTLAVILDLLEGSFRPPGTPEEWGRVGASGRVESGSVVVVDSLVVESPESQLRVRGTLPLALDGLGSGLVDLRMAAEPLHLRDLGPLLPTAVSDSIRLYAQGEARSADGVLLVELEADSRGAGRLEVQGEVGGEAADPTVRGRVRLAGLDLRAWGVGADRMVVDAMVEVDVAGVPDRASGFGSAEGILRHEGQGLEVRGRLLARSDSSGGPWRAEWSVASPGVEADGTGTVVLGDPLISTLEGRLAYDRAAGGPPIPGADVPIARGRFRWDGQGSSLDSLTVLAEVRIDTAAVNRGSVEGLLLTAEARLGQASLFLDGAVAGGRVSARGEVDLADLSGRLLEVRVDDVDLAALAGDSVPSSVSATASGSLDSLSPLQAFGSLQVLGAAYGEVRVDSAWAVADVRGETTNLRLYASFADSGQVRLTGRIDSSEGATTMRVDSLRFVHVNLRALVGAENAGGMPATDLSGAGTADLAAVDGGWEGRASLGLSPSRVGTQVVEEGVLRAELRGTNADLNLDIHLPDGGITAEARLEGLDTLPSIVVSQLRFQAVDVGALLDRDEMAIHLSGRMEGRLRGGGPGGMVGEGLVVLEESRVAALPVETATLEIQMEGGRVGGTLAGRVGGGRVWAEADLDIPQAGSTEAAGGSPATGHVPASRADEEGPTSGVGALAGRVSAEVDSVTWEGVRLDRGRLRLAAVEGVLHLDTLSLRSEDGFLVAAGMLPLSASGGRDGEIRFQGELAGADLLTALSGADLAAVGSGVLEGTVTGALDDLEVVANATVDALLLDDVRVQGVDIQGRAQYAETEGLVRGAGTLGIDELRIPGISLRRMDAEAVMEPGEDLAVTVSATMDDLRDGAVSARVEMAPAPLALTVERLDVRMDRDRWTLAHPVRIDLSDGIKIDSLALGDGAQQVLAGGRVGAHGPLDLRVDVRDVRVEAVAGMAGLPGLRGPVSGVVVMGGTAEAPLLEVNLSGHLESDGAPAADLALDAAFADRALTFEATARLEDARGARAGGTLPLDFSLASPSGGLVDGETIFVEAAADSLPLDWVGLFLPSGVARDLDGVLDGTVRIEGHPESPRFAGSLDLAGASLRLPALGVEYRRVEARVRLQEDRILLDSLRVRSGRGSLLASGAVTLPRLDEPEFAATVTADRFHAIQASGVDATVSGELELSGRASRPALSGWIELERAEFQMGDMVSAPGVRTVTLSEGDYQELAEVFGYHEPSETRTAPDFFDLSSLNVDVRLRRDSWVRQRANPEMAVQFAGQVSVRKEPGDPLRLVGTVESVPRRSYVQQFGRRFSIASGVLNFQGTPLDTRIDLRAEYAVPSRDPGDPAVTVALDITGTPEDLRLELSSTPDLSPSDMVSYIVTGRPAGETLASDEGGGSLTDAGEAFALGRLTGVVEAYAREQVGLDVVEITTDGLKGMTLVAGRYVSPSLYLGIRQPLSLQRSSGDSSERPPEPELEVELEAVRWLLLNLQAGGRSEVQLFLRSRIAYD